MMDETSRMDYYLSIVRKVNQFESMLGITFNTKELLVQTLTHRSFLNENHDFKLPHNERLEFLGDGVLELVVKEYLFRNYNNPEGDLTSFRASLVNIKMLVAVAKELQLEEFILQGKGQANDTSRAKERILGNTVEALIGAIYIDQERNVVEEFIAKYFLAKLPNIIAKKLYLDAKSKLQEITQNELGITPNYEMINTQGPDHQKIFTVAVYFGDELIATGSGVSKKQAQFVAAEQALKLKGWD